MVLVSSFGIGWSAPVAGTALVWVGLAGKAHDTKKHRWNSND